LSIVTLVLLIALAAAAVWTVFATSLLRSVIGLAVTSVVLSVLIFRLGSPVAAMFELSVCAGLITAIFVSAISMLKPAGFDELAAAAGKRFKRYRWLVVILIFAAFALVLFEVPADFAGIFASTETDVRKVLWDLRQTDLIGQVLIILVGIFAVTILFSKKADKQ
jgi:NADH-quinone oxidoreductase subunit J